MDNLVALLQRSANDGAALSAHVEKNLDRIISDWTYAYGTSNLGQLGSSTLALAHLLENDNLAPEVATKVAIRVLDDDLKIIYRALTQARPVLTLPALNLLKHVAKLVPIELTTQFDFTLRIIPKLLTTKPFREAFLKFYIQLTRSAPAHLRKDLLSTRNVFSAWIGKLGQEDEPEIVHDTIYIFKELVLKDVTTFSKTTKMSLFNDWTLKNMVRLLGILGASDPELASSVASFLSMLLCDRHFGVRMAGENALAKSFLKIVKPWENTVQMDLVIKLLHDMPELILPHFDALAPVYPLTPKASMWWFSFSVLHIRVMKLKVPLPVPSGADEFASPPSLEVASKSLLPTTVTKTALQQALQFKDSKLIHFQAAQIVLLAVQRLSQLVSDVYIPRKWNSNELIDEILTNRLPDVHMFTRGVEPGLLMATHLAIVREICKLRPLNINVQLPLGAHTVTGLDLIRAENILEIQTMTSDQTRWWNPSKDEPSLFTQLLKFATFNPKLAGKSSQLLQHLVEPTQLFADMYTLAHPVDGLLFTLSEHQSDLIWSLMDQTVQRAVRTPYQYIDKVRSESVSPFAVAATEQYASHFSGQDSDGLLKRFMHSFLRSLIVLGEDSTVIEKLLKDDIKTDSDTAGKVLLSSDQFVNFVLDASDEAVLRRTDLVFKITNSLELAATLYRAAISTNSDVRNYLLASIPEDMLDLLTSPPAYGRFITASRDSLQSYLAILEGRTSEDLCRDLELSANWDLGIPHESDGFLMTKLVDTHNVRILKELNSRRIELPLEMISNLIALDGIAENLLLRESKSVSVDLACTWAASVTNAETAAAVVTISGFYDPSSKFAYSAPVLTAAARFAQDAIDASIALKTALDLVDRGDKAGLCILSELMKFDRITAPFSDPSSIVWESVAAFIERGKSGVSHSVLLPEIAQIVDGFLAHDNGVLPFLSRWLKIAVLQLTRRLAEHKLESEHLEFVDVFSAVVLDKVDIWAQVHSNELNALIDGSIRYGRDARLYAMVSRVAIKGRGKPLKAAGHLLTLLESPADSSIEKTVLIFALFCADPGASSTLEIEQGILARYSGSVKAVDQILLTILETIESNRQRSWVDSVQSWEIRPARANLALLADDYGIDPLIMLKKNDVFVTLDEVRVKESVQKFELYRPWTLKTVSSYDEVVRSIDKYDSQGPTDPVAYDSRFLLNTVVSCNYLLERSELFLTSGLFAFVVCCLADERLEETAFRVLSHVSKLVQQRKFKDQIGMSLITNKVLTLYVQRREKGLAVPSYLAIMAGQVAQLIARPNHFLHEKASGWLMEGPAIREADVPLFSMIAKSQAETKPRELVWLVHAFTSSMVNKEAVDVFSRQGVIEWCLANAQLASPRSAALRTAVEQFIRRVEEVTGGSLTLASRSGAMVIPGVAQAVLQSVGPQRLIEEIVQN